jgi:hypothetical protein
MRLPRFARNDGAYEFRNTNLNNNVTVKEGNDCDSLIDGLRRFVSGSYMLLRLSKDCRATLAMTERMSCEIPTLRHNEGGQRL